MEPLAGFHCYSVLKHVVTRKQGEEEAIGSHRDEFDWLLSREIPHLRRYARALVKDPVFADDLVQDCLERALRKWRLWTPRGHLRSWLFRMLFRVYLNQKQQARRGAADLALEDSLEPVSNAAPHSLRVEIRETAKALDALPEDQRAAILLVALEDMNYDEAAWILNVPIGTLRSRLSRAREALRAAARTAEPESPPLRRIK